MPYSISRRRALAGLSAAAALPLVGCAASGERQGAAESIYAHGVASGDPDANSVVLWTRLSGVSGKVSGRWVVFRDADFREVLADGSFQTDAGRDYTVKVLATGLPAGAELFYRFTCEGQESPIGRTRTLPSGHLERLGIAVASCTNYAFGYFNAYQAIALDDQVDLVLHLGDYIYEYGPDGYGGDVGAMLGREHLPAREIVTLADYRIRHAQYKAEPQSRAMHAAHPLVAAWDDHESTNNSWSGGAENHQPDMEGEWKERRRVSLQAYYEWMPVREPSAGWGREDYWRHLRFGDLASLITLETRHTGRDRQVDYELALADVRSPEDARRFEREVLGAEGREMLSTEGKAALESALEDSVAAGRPWRLIGNQVLMARMRAPRLTDAEVEALAVEPSNPLYEDVGLYRAMGDLGLPLSTDTWDGYPRAREALYDMARSAGATDLLVLTGDSHAFWQNALFDIQGRPAGLELGTSGITSPSDFMALGPEQADFLDKVIAEQNPEVLWANGSTNGYVRLVLTPARALVSYVGVDTVRSTEFSPVNLRQLEIRRDGGTLRYVDPTA